MIMNMIPLELIIPKEFYHYMVVYHHARFC